eukprot:6214113-Pleurochrysis_carterae.AAC.1
MSTWMSRPACDGRYSSFGWGSRVELASAQAAHDGGKAWRRLCGASAVRLVSCLSRAPPQCKRRCM